MKKLSLLVLTLAVVFTGCSSSQFSAIDGTLPAGETVVITGDADETASVSFSKVNGKVAPGAKSVLAPQGTITITADYVRGADKFSKELSFEAKGGKTYKVSFRSEDVEYKMGSKDTKHKVVLYIKDGSGAFLAGSDSKNDMEFAVQ